MQLLGSTIAALLVLPQCSALTPNNSSCTSPSVYIKLPARIHHSPHHTLSASLSFSVRCCIVMLQPIVQWGFIPAIIVAGMMFTKPRPTLGQLVLLG
jgi:hypothetical protein